MHARRTRWSIGMALLALLLWSPARAAAHVGVFVGGGGGYPYAYPYYPYAYSYPYAPYAYPYAYPPPVYYAPQPVPPPGFVQGHWESRWDPYGNRVRVWVPGHLN